MVRRCQIWYFYSLYELYNPLYKPETIVINDHWGKDTWGKHGGYLTVEYGNLGDKDADSVSMPGFKGKVKYSASRNKLTITPPQVSPSTNPCQHAWVYKVTNGVH